ncbi:unnamed protein product [Amoebophrya sp. A25]|nr:unnamed protein product [Amoebophrya sp. A25]|eukprot:GSA25T00020173001.1
MLPQRSTGGPLGGPGGNFPSRGVGNSPYGPPSAVTKSEVRREPLPFSDEDVSGDEMAGRGAFSGRGGTRHGKKHSDKRRRQGLDGSRHGGNLPSGTNPLVSTTVGSTPLSAGLSRQGQSASSNGQICGENVFHLPVVKRSWSYPVCAADLGKLVQSRCGKRRRRKADSAQAVAPSATSPLGNRRRSSTREHGPGGPGSAQQIMLGELLAEATQSTPTKRHRSSRGIAEGSPVSVGSEKVPAPPAGASKRLSSAVHLESEVSAAHHAFTNFPTAAPKMMRDRSPSGVGSLSRQATANTEVPRQFTTNTDWHLSRHPSRSSARQQSKTSPPLGGQTAIERNDFTSSSDEDADDIFDSRYLNLTPLARSGFGRVYKALDVYNDGAPVAVKMESLSALDHVLIAEARALEDLQGVLGVPKLYGYGSQFIQNFLVMELVGPNLSMMMERHPPFDVKTWVLLGLQIARILEQIHRRGYVHRDIKPSNFALTFPESKTSKSNLMEWSSDQLFHRRGARSPSRSSLSGVGRSSPGAGVVNHAGAALAVAGASVQLVDGGRAKNVSLLGGVERGMSRTSTRGNATPTAGVVAASTNSRESIKQRQDAFAISQEKGTFRVGEKGWAYNYGKCIVLLDYGLAKKVERRPKNVLFRKSRNKKKLVPPPIPEVEALRMRGEELAKEAVGLISVGPGLPLSRGPSRGAAVNVGVAPCLGSGGPTLGSHSTLSEQLSGDGSKHVVEAKVTDGPRRNNFTALSDGSVKLEADSTKQGSSRKSPTTRIGGNGQSANELLESEDEVQGSASKSMPISTSTLKAEVKELRGRGGIEEGSSDAIQLRANSNTRLLEVEDVCTDSKQSGGETTFNMEIIGAPGGPEAGPQQPAGVGNSKQTHVDGSSDKAESSAMYLTRHAFSVSKSASNPNLSEEINTEKHANASRTLSTARSSDTQTNSVVLAGASTRPNKASLGTGPWRPGSVETSSERGTGAFCQRNNFVSGSAAAVVDVQQSMTSSAKMNPTDYISNSTTTTTKIPASVISSSVEVELAVTRLARAGRGMSLDHHLQDLVGPRSFELASSEGLKLSKSTPIGIKSVTVAEQGLKSMNPLQRSRSACSSMEFVATAKKEAKRRSDQVYYERGARDLAAPSPVGSRLSGNPPGRSPSSSEPLAPGTVFAPMRVLENVDVESTAGESSAAPPTVIGSEPVTIGSAGVLSQKLRFSPEPCQTRSLSREALDSLPAGKNMLHRSDSFQSMPVVSAVEYLGASRQGEQLPGRSGVETSFESGGRAPPDAFAGAAGAPRFPLLRGSSTELEDVGALSGTLREATSSNRRSIEMKREYELDGSRANLSDGNLNVSSSLYKNYAGGASNPNSGTGVCRGSGRHRSAVDEADLYRRAFEILSSSNVTDVLRILTTGNMLSTFVLSGMREGALPVAGVEEQRIMRALMKDDLMRSSGRSSSGRGGRNQSTLMSSGDGHSANNNMTPQEAVAGYEESLTSGGASPLGSLELPGMIAAARGRNPLGSRGVTAGSFASSGLSFVPDPTRPKGRASAPASASHVWGEIPTTSQQLGTYKQRYTSNIDEVSALMQSQSYLQSVTENYQVTRSTTTSILAGGPRSGRELVQPFLGSELLNQDSSASRERALRLLAAGATQAGETGSMDVSLVARLGRVHMMQHNGVDAAASDSVTIEGANVSSTTLTRNVAVLDGLEAKSGYDPKSCTHASPVSDNSVAAHSTAYSSGGMANKRIPGDQKGEGGERQQTRRTRHEAISPLEEILSHNERTASKDLSGESFIGGPLSTTNAALVGSGFGFRARTVSDLVARHVSRVVPGSSSPPTLQRSPGRSNRDRTGSPHGKQGPASSKHVSSSSQFSIGVGAPVPHARERDGDGAESSELEIAASPSQYQQLVPSPQGRLVPSQSLRLLLQDADFLVPRKRIWFKQIKVEDLVQDRLAARAREILIRSTLDQAPASRFHTVSAYLKSAERRNRLKMTRLLDNAIIPVPRAQNGKKTRKALLRKSNSISFGEIAVEGSNGKVATPPQPPEGLIEKLKKRSADSAAKSYEGGRSEQDQSDRPETLEEFRKRSERHPMGLIMAFSVPQEATPTGRAAVPAPPVAGLGPQLKSRSSDSAGKSSEGGRSDPFQSDRPVTVEDLEAQFKRRSQRHPMGIFMASPFAKASTKTTALTSLGSTLTREAGNPHDDVDTPHKDQLALHLQSQNGRLARSASGVRFARDGSEASLSIASTAVLERGKSTSKEEGSMAGDGSLSTASEASDLDSEDLYHSDDEDLVGTVEYASPRAHEPGRSRYLDELDDLYAFGYTMVAMVTRGRLPWTPTTQPRPGRNSPPPRGGVGTAFRRNASQDRPPNGKNLLLANAEEIGRLKRDIPIEELCKNCPPQFAQFFRVLEDMMTLQDEAATHRATDRLMRRQRQEGPSRNSSLGAGGATSGADNNSNHARTATATAAFSPNNPDFVTSAAERSSRKSRSAPVVSCHPREIVMPRITDGGGLGRSRTTPAPKYRVDLVCNMEDYSWIEDLFLKIADEEQIDLQDCGYYWDRTRSIAGDHLEAPNSYPKALKMLELRRSFR